MRHFRKLGIGFIVFVLILQSMFISGIATSANDDISLPVRYQLYDYFADVESARASGGQISSASPWSVQVQPAGGTWASVGTSFSRDGNWTYLFDAEKHWGNYPGVSFHYPASLSGRYMLNLIAPTNSANSTEWFINTAYTFTAPYSGTYQFGKGNQDAAISWDAANNFSQYDKSEALDFGVRVTKNGSTIWNGDSSVEKRDGFAVFGSKTAQQSVVAVPDITDIAMNAGDELRVEFTVFTPCDSSPWAQRISGMPEIQLTAISDEPNEPENSSNYFDLYDYFADVEAARVSGGQISSASPWSVQVQPAGGTWASVGTSFSRDGNWTYLFDAAKSWGSYPGVSFYYPSNRNDRYMLNLITPTNSANSPDWSINAAYVFTAPSNGFYHLGKGNQDLVISWDSANYFSQYNQDEALDFGVRITKNGYTIWDGDSDTEKRDGYAVFGNKTAQQSTIAIPDITGIAMNAGDELRVEFTVFTPCDSNPWAQRISGTPSMELVRTFPIEYDVYDFFDEVEACRIAGTDVITSSPWSVQTKALGAGWASAGSSIARDNGYTYVYNGEHAWGNYPGYCYYAPETMPADGRYHLARITPTNSAWGGDDDGWCIDAAYAFTAPYDGIYTLGRTNQDLAIAWNEVNYFSQYDTSTQVDFGIRITKNDRVIWNGDSSAEKRNGFAVFGTKNAQNEKIAVPFLQNIDLKTGDVIRVEFTNFTPVQDVWTQRINGLVSMTFNHPHDYVKTVHPATCTEEGYAEYTCSCCGDHYIVPSGEPATGHQIENGVCSVCGLTEEVIQNVAAKSAVIMKYLQTAVQLKQNDDSCDLRYISMLDSNLADYESVGFIMEMMGYEQKISTPTVYTSFMDETAGKVTASQYGADYFILTTTNVGSDLYGEKITVRPFAELVGGGIIKGRPLQFVLSDYIGG